MDIDITADQADAVIQRLRLDDYVEEYEERDEAHWYHLGGGLHLRIGYDGSIELVDDEGDSIDLSKEGYATEQVCLGGRS